MKKNEAINLFLSHNHQARKVFDRIMKFEPGMSGQEFATKIGLPLPSMYNFARNYGLKFSDRSKHHANSMYIRNRKKIMSRWDETKPLKENARLLDVSLAAASQYTKRYKLKYEFQEMRQSTINRLLRVKSYMDKGLSDAEIGRITGYSRQKIGQDVSIIKNDKRFRRFQNEKRKN